MNCLCCGKPVLAERAVSGWHPACVKKFFGAKTLPVVDLTDEALTQLASQTIRQKITVPGVQKKLSLHLTKGSNPRLTLVDYPSGYILKPQVDEFRHMPEAEHLVMTMAERAGIATVPHALLTVDGKVAYITKRVDRATAVDGTPQRLAMEDFCQLDLRLTRDKYRGSYERCEKIIRRHSSQVGLDVTELFMRLVFCFLTGNSDMHLKNFSLLETALGSGRYTLSPAYDLLPVNLLLPEDQEELALTLNGKKTRLRRKDFLVYADACLIPRKAAEAMLNRLLAFVPVWLTLCGQSLLPEDMKRDFAALIAGRAATLGKGAEDGDARVGADTVSNLQ